MTVPENRARVADCQFWFLALVNQLELAALNQAAKKDNKPTRSADSVDDSRRYRDNVAEYYRKLGEANDGK